MMLLLSDAPAPMLASGLRSCAENRAADQASDVAGAALHLPVYTATAPSAAP